MPGFQEMFSIAIRRAHGRPDALGRTLDSLAAQSYRNFEIIVEEQDEASAYPDDFASARGLFRQKELQPSELLSAQSAIWRGDYLMLVDAGDIFSPDALEKMNAAVQSQTGFSLPDLVIFDHQLSGGVIRHLPGWDPDLLQHHDYVLRACAVWRGKLERFSVPPGDLAALLVRLTEEQACVVHVPHVLMELEAELAPIAPMAAPQGQAPAVSIIIANKHGLDLLSACTAFLGEMKSEFELIIVDHVHDDPGARRVYDELTARHGAKILNFNGPFNYSAMMNMGARAARHAFLLFLNNDVVIQQASSLTMALHYAARPGIGIVGSLLRYADGSVQHAGMVTRRWKDDGGYIVHALRGETHDEKGHIGALSAPRNWQSVTGAFHVLRKTSFLDAGQFDEANLPIEWNDVDLCFRLRKLGLRVVCLPLPGITHAEGQTRRLMDPAEVEPINLAASQEMKRRWPEAFASDPYENPNLRPDAVARPQERQLRKKVSIRRRLKKLPAKIAQGLYGALQRGPAEPVALPSPQIAQTRLRLKPGISIIGYLHSEIGLGETARQLSFACDRARVPASLVDVPLVDRDHETSFRTLCQPVADRRVSLVICGMDQVRHLLARTRQERLRVAYPFWELPEIPAEFRTDLEPLDELWAPSRFIATSLEGAVSKPVRLVRQPVALPIAAPAIKPRGDKLRFFTFFDFGSYFHRKNPMGTIAAFKAAFPGRKDVELVIKARGKDKAGARSQLAKAVGNDPRIRLIDATLSRQEMSVLMTQADAFVSLHRSEGFGFGAAEALAHGKAVIATDWGGGTDFIQEATGYPIAYKLRPLQPGEYIHGEGQHWAEPSLDAAVAAMRRVDSHPDEGYAKALAGYKLLSHQHSHAVVGAEIARALSELAG